MTDELIDEERAVMTVMIWPSGVIDLNVDADATDWAGVTVDDLSELAGRTRPLRRLLLMLGYQVDHLLVQAHVGDSWAQLDLVSMEAWALVGSGSGSGGEFGRDFSGPVLALPISAYFDLRAAESAPVTMGLPLATSLTEWTVNTETGYLFLRGSPLQPVQNAFVDSLDLIVPAILESAQEILESAPLEPRPGSGLLWLTDPETWFADMEAMRGSPAFAELESMALIARGAVSDTLGDAGTPEVDFLTEQTILQATPLTGARAPWFYRHRSPNLKQLLRWTPEGDRYFSRHADRFFTCLGVWLAERHQEGVLSAAELEELRDAPWFGVLAMLVDRGNIDPPALASSVAEEFEDEEPPPVVAERVDSVTVDLTVRRSVTIRLTLVRDATGAIVQPSEPEGEDKSLLDPIPEFSWDYLVPTDPAELPQLAIVAAPRGRHSRCLAVDTDYDNWTLADGLWDATRMADLLEQNEAVTVAGTVDNQVEFYDRFDHVILLTAPLDVLLERVAFRMSNPYGQSTEDRAEITHYVRTVEPLLRLGATHELDGRAPPESLVEVVEGLLKRAS